MQNKTLNKIIQYLFNRKNSYCTNIILKQERFEINGWPLETNNQIKVLERYLSGTEIDIEYIALSSKVTSNYE